MANFALLIDPDEGRRACWVGRAEAKLAPVPHLEKGRIALGDAILLWAADPQAPISSFAEPERATVLFGIALTESSTAPIDAKAAAGALDPEDGRPAEALDGFHAAAVCRRDTVVVGADLLGLFPVYYCQYEDVVLIGSSPEPFKLHPLFEFELDPATLVELLLIHAPLDGNTLMRGVRRLRPGRTLRWHRGDPLRECPQYSIPCSDRYDGLPFTEHIELLDRTFGRALERQAPPGSPQGLLLSGGRDSRLLGGYLGRHGNRVTALTLGTPTDYELQCGSLVARTLGFEARAAEVDQDRFVWAAEQQARWEHLVSGYSSIHMWTVIDHLRELPPTTVTGHVREARETPAMPTAFEAFFEETNERGIAPDRLRCLLKGEERRDLVDHCLDRIRRAYVETCSRESERSWRFRLAHGARFHPGGVPWRLTFGSWPVLPILDRRSLELIASLPETSLADRRAQDEILRSRFPQLARLPLDRNAGDTTPLLPTLGARIARKGRRLLRRLRFLDPHEELGPERRYYYRLYDFNSPGWRSVRRRAEPHRPRVADLFDMHELSRLVPLPETDLVPPHGAIATFGNKILVGFLIWSSLQEM